MGHSFWNLYKARTCILKFLQIILLQDVDHFSCGLKQPIRAAEGDGSLKVASGSQARVGSRTAPMLVICFSRSELGSRNLYFLKSFSDEWNLGIPQTFIYVLKSGDHPYYPTIKSNWIKIPLEQRPLSLGVQRTQVDFMKMWVLTVGLGWGLGPCVFNKRQCIYCSF